MPKRTYSIALLPGDGTGVEVAAQARRVLDAIAAKTDISFDIEEIPCGGQYFLEHGRDWPEGSEEKCKRADVSLLGAVGWPDPKGGGPVTMPDGNMAGWSPVIGNRMRLDLYANIRPVKLYEGVKARISGERKQVWQPKDVDMLFLRENTEDLYAGHGGTLRRGGRTEMTTDVRIITRSASERIIRLAFELCMKRNGAPKDGKKRVTCIVKNNVMEGCRFFAELFHEIGAEYPDIEKDEAIVDAFTQWLIGQPEYYDVLVTTNMFGDIVTDLASVLQGGMGMAVGCNVGDEHAMFEPIHGSAPRHAGKDKVNPIAMILATGEGLKWLGDKKDDAELKAAGAHVETAVRAVLKRGEPLTYDIVGEAKAAKMSECGSAIVDELNKLLG
ncbi:MAG: isocitrate/isopropylmalate dehydrogenase family protein [Deltaproteobacteria bacterium]|jgi:3-isopropylmalate dehydrogenase|nr:isocitrate/isopropylmalate dehydrogenase family protein [Deltaproteobacteria bacterium]MBW2533434.1 isocitrate/isopropylmalate dehydrogenase family protein [Deltaproteobacteria bacterium]